jgi:threonine/homoserine/homoserine lactone efflux protein
VTLDLILIGLTISLEPIPLTTFIVVLASKNGVRKGAAFLFGWLASLAIVIALTIVATGNKPPKTNSAPSLAALAFKILAGVVLLLIALRQYRRLGKPKPPKKTPKWQTGVDNMSLWFALALGPLTQPWGLVAVGIATITEAKLSSWQDYIAIVLFCLVSTSTYLVMEVYAGFRPARTQALLAQIRTWIETHRDQVIIVGSIVLGFYLIGKSTYLLVT